MSDEPEEDLTEESYVVSKTDVFTFSGEKIQKKPKPKGYLFVFAFLLLFGLAFWGALHFWKVESHISVSNPISDQAVLHPIVRIELNEANFSKEWKEHVFNGRTMYQVEHEENEGNVLHASSRNTSSLIYREANVPLSNRPFLTWEWKTIQFPSNKENKVFASKRDNDFAARIYVAFKGRTPLVSDVIQYVWDDHFPEGSFTESPYLRSTKILVIRSGIASSPSGWVPEKRDLILDYEKLYSRHPKGNVVAMGIMSDSDNTGTVSEAYFKNILIQGPEIKEEVSTPSKRQLPIIGGAVSRIWRILSGQRQVRSQQSKA